MSARFFPYRLGAVGNARRLRREMTDAERKLWYELRRRQTGAYFRRQVPIGPFIADFLCIKANLVIELDGSQHYTEEGIQHDSNRDAYLREKGLLVERFSNDDVLTSMDSVLQRIYELIDRAK